MTHDRSDQPTSSYVPRHARPDDVPKQRSFPPPDGPRRRAGPPAQRGGFPKDPDDTGDILD